MHANETQSPEQDRPVFVLAQHRSGGTLLTRLLNCHPGLVIWGEHAGFLNKLAEAQDSWIGTPACCRIARRRNCGIMFPAASGTRFPRGPFHLAVPRSWPDAGPWCAGLFAPGLRPGQRWGFKEIRYHSPTVVRFLRRLFPAAQFILLNRDPIELCVSDMLVSWALGSLMAERVQTDRRLPRG